MEDAIFQEQSLHSQTFQPAQSPRMPSSPQRYVRFFILIIILGLLGFGTFRFLSTRGSSAKPTPTPTPTPTVSVEPTSTLPSDTPNLSPTGTPVPTAKPTTSPVDSATGLDRSTLSVAVQNGGGVVGAGSKVSDSLKTLGYNVVSVGNADNFSYETTSILVKSTKSSYLSLLKKDLGSSYTIGTASATLSDSSTSDAVVIVGKQ